MKVHLIGVNDPIGPTQDIAEGAQQHHAKGNGNQQGLKPERPERGLRLVHQLES